MPLEARGRAVDARAGLGDQPGGRAVVLCREVDDLEPLRRDRHRGHDHVDLACLERGDHAVEVELHERTLGLHLRAQRLGDVDVEALDLPVGPDRTERRIGTLDTDAQARLVGRRRGERQREDEHREQADERTTVHVGTPRGDAVDSRAFRAWAVWDAGAQDVQIDELAGAQHGSALRALGFESGRRKQGHRGIVAVLHAGLDAQQPAQPSAQSSRVASSDEPTPQPCHSGATKSVRPAAWRRRSVAATDRPA